MVAAAPRYHPVLVAAIAELDDDREPIAELCRRVGVVAEALGVARPSYVHVRRYAKANRVQSALERERRAAVRRILIEAGSDLMLGKFVHPYELADRIQAAQTGG